MKFVGINKVEDCILLRYNTTWKLSWSNILDIMQVYLEDILPHVTYAGYLPIAGDSPTSVTTITEGLLHKTKEFTVERGAMVLAGLSKAHKANFTMIIYNQTNIVDIQIPTTDEDFVDDLYNDNHLLDVYMNSLEINGYARDAKRNGINLFGRFLAMSKDHPEYPKEASQFKETCIEICATPFPQMSKSPKQVISENIQCPVCQHEFQYDNSKIPDGERYEVTCPKCGMLMKRKKS